MNSKIYKKEDSVEVIFESSPKHFDKKLLEEEVVELYGRIEGWKNLLEVEAGYSPKEEKDECPTYSMPKIVIRHYLGDDEDGILKHEPAYRNKSVDEWIKYHKITLKKKNPLRNIDSLFKIFDVELTKEQKEKIKILVKEDSGSIAI